MEKEGLQVIFDGDKNLVVDEDKTFADLTFYPIGGMICEYLRFNPEQLTEIVRQIPHFDDPWEDYFFKSWEWFAQNVKETFDRIPAGMISIEFLNFIYEYINESDEYKGDVLDNYGIDAASILNQTDPDMDDNAVVSLETVGQLYLCAHALFIRGFAMVKSAFENSNNESKSRQFRLVGYERNSDSQDISYRIVRFDDGFHSIYKIKDSWSLLLFDSAHLINSGIKVRKCKNCGHYFVPVGRSDAVYCGYPSPENPNKTCRDIGARNTRVKLEKNDLVTSEYRRLYKRLKAAIYRHPEDKSLEISLSKLTGGMGEMRKKREAGAVSADDILEWLHHVEDDL